MNRFCPRWCRSPLVAGSRLLGAAIVLLLTASIVQCDTAEERIIIYEASRQLGPQVIEALLEQQGKDPGSLILVTRRPDTLEHYAELGASVRHGDPARPETLRSAYEGGTRMLMLTGSPIPNRMELHRNAIDAAAAAGVSHLIYTSTVDVANPDSGRARDHRRTEDHIRDSGLDWTMLRLQLYIDGTVLNMASRMISDREVMVSPDEEPVAYVSMDDCAAVAAAVLTGSSHRNRIYNVTGPELVSLKDIAAIATELTGVDIEAVKGEAAMQGYYTPVSGFRGHQVQSNVVEELTGRPAVTVRERMENSRTMLENAVEDPGAIWRRGFL